MARPKASSVPAKCLCEGSDHFVQFYEGDEFLVQTVGRFVSEGLRAGAPAVIIATPDHVAGVDAFVTSAGLPIDELIRADKYVRLDAQTTLRQFTVDGTPDETLFRKVVGALVARLATGAPNLWAFGEMVALLWQQGCAEGAIQLEEFWNRLAAEHRFKLLCAYPMSGFRSNPAARHLTHVCRTHRRVLPTEAFQPQDGLSATQLRQIAVLQQRAAALEAEVAERSESEAKLRRRENELTTFVETASIGLHWVDADGRIVWANRAELELLGYAPDEYIGHSISEFHADAPIIDDILSRLCRGEKLRDYEARLRCKNGAIKTVLIDSSVLWDDGRFVHTQCFTRDITDHKARADALERAREELSRANSLLEVQVADLRQLHNLTSKFHRADGVQSLLQELLAAALDVNQTNQGLLSLVAPDGDGLRVAASRGFADDVVQQLAFVPLGQGACGLCQLKRERVLIEDVCTDPAFEPFRDLARQAGFRAVHSTPLLAQDGRLVGVLSVHFAESRRPTERAMQLMDLYARHAADLIENARLREELERELERRRIAGEELQTARDELARINLDLEQRVRDRTAALTDLLSQVETFSYTVSHDLRAPLRAMVGYAEALVTDYAPKLDGDAQQYLHRILRACERMNRMITDVLAYTRVNRDRIDFVPIDPRAMLENVIVHAPEMQQPNAIIHIPDSGAPVLGNETFITQVLANLLGNAVKFVPAGRAPEITVSFHPAGEMIRTEIQDNGIGILPQHQGQLFGLFQRLTSDYRYEGTGIGLAIVKRAIERMGGSVGVSSEPGCGSRFWFTLRAAPIAADGASGCVSAVAGAEALGPGLKTQC